MRTLDACVTKFYIKRLIIETFTIGNDNKLTNVRVSVAECRSR